VRPQGGWPKGLRKRIRNQKLGAENASVPEKEGSVEKKERLAEGFY